MKLIKYDDSVMGKGCKKLCPYGEEKNFAGSGELIEVGSSACERCKNFYSKNTLSKEVYCTGDKKN